MKKLIFTLLATFLSVTSLFAQHVIEYAVFAQAGTSHYTGTYTSRLSFFDRQGAVDNPYGSKQTFNYITSFGALGQSVIKSHFIVGLQLGLENVRSENKIDHFENRVNPNFTIDAKSTLHTQFLSFSPYVGYRVTSGNFKLDIMPGFDIAVKLKGRMELTQNFSDDPSESALIDYRYKDIPADLRARMGFTAYYNRFGISANYTRGLSNYVKDNPKAAGKTAYTELIRFGITYRIF